MNSELETASILVRGLLVIVLAVIAIDVAGGD